MKQANLLDAIRQQISSHTDSPYLDAQVLLSEVLNKSRAWVLAHPDPPITEEESRTLDSMLEDIQQGTPLPYVVEHRAFFKLDFKINSQVLIPRPETEYLVEKGIQWLEVHPERRRAVDIGTGSGVIAVSLAKEVPNLQLVATDLSLQALELARKNASDHQVMDQIHFCQTDLLAGIQAQFDLICANLPYVPTTKLTKLPVFRKEPRLALDGGPNGLQVIDRLLKTVHESLAPGGILLLEIDEDKGSEAKSLAREQFPSARITLKKDLARQDRYLLLEDTTR